MIAVPAARLAPDEAARRAGAEPGAFWLSTPAPDEVGIARDIVGAAPVRVVRGDSPADLIRVEAAWGEARAAWLASGARPPAGVPAAVGWFSYDLGRAFNGLPARAPAAGDGPSWPAVELHFHDAVWVREAGGDATIFAQDEAAARRLGERLATPSPAIDLGRGGWGPPPLSPPEPSREGTRRAKLAGSPRGESLRLGALTADHPDGLFLDGVRRVLEYLRAGDAYQVNLSRRLSATIAPWSGSAPVALAAALRARAPAPHAALIASADGDGALVGNSPERFLAVAVDGTVETRPIKGTRSRGGTPEADRAAAAALRASPKDRAEHVMIVDLERNDLGRVCRTGSVGVASLARVVALPTLHHLVSTVRGSLRPDVGLAALLAATFPGGSITGAPKRRAMQIIDELEPAPRGPYTGATGWLGAAGDLDLAIAIRTAVVRPGRLSLSVGGGIVADSTPEDELAETEVKARAFAALCGGNG